MPGPISDSHKGTPEHAPYVPSYLYPKGPKMCPCGHHEGYHNDKGTCLRVSECGCKGLPSDCETPSNEL